MEKKLYKVLVDAKIGDTERVIGENVELSEEEVAALPEGTVEIVEGGVDGAPTTKTDDAE